MTVVAASVPAARRPASPSAWAMVAHQLRFDARVLVRNRQARFFTVALPALMLVLFCSIFHNGFITVAGHPVRSSTYYVGTQATFGVVDAGFATLAIWLVTTREAGAFKRRRATPQPPWVLMASRAVTGVITAVAVGAVLVGIGSAAFSASLGPRALAGLAAAVVIGAVAFTALGFAVSGLIRSVEAAQPTALGLMLPLMFVSGVFIPWGMVPPWLRAVATVFPVRHLAVAVVGPVSGSGGIAWSDLGVVALWGLAGAVVAARRFRWSPVTAAR